MANEDRWVKGPATKGVRLVVDVGSDKQITPELIQGLVKSAQELQEVAEYALPFKCLGVTVTACEILIICGGVERK